LTDNAEDLQACIEHLENKQNYGFIKNKVKSRCTMKINYLKALLLMRIDNNPGSCSSAEPQAKKSRNN